MITPLYAQTMARYNQWQNTSLFGAADGLTDENRQENRGAFFGSIHITLAHILWGDTIWMHRFDGWDAPDAPGPWFDVDWAELKTRRAKADERILGWAERLTQTGLSGDLTWYSGAVAREVTKSRDLLIVQMFNHQTHHRGQVHAMLTAAGATPDDTDLPFMEIRTHA